jgi:2-oxoglutarate dehydrogenase E2 component (dihydrolipoamide succinyltransferase)
MSINIVVPDLGESVVEATVLRWLKQEGERVATGETVVELETEKVNLEVSAPQAGVLARIEHKAGEDVKIGDVLGVIEQVPEPTAPSPLPPSAGEGQGVRATEQVKATPVAERMAAEYGVDLRQIAPSALEQRVTKQDVENYVEKQRAEQQVVATPPSPAREVATPPPPSVEREATSGPIPQIVISDKSTTARERADREERVRMSRRRQTIARRLVEAQHTAAMLTTFNEIDMSAVMEIRKQRKESFKQRYDVGLGITSFFVKAAIGALKAFPRVNAEIQGDEMVLKHYYDIGIAVGAEEGLVVPVLRDADRMSFAEIEKGIDEFVQKAEAGTLTLEDLRGGTFTITNGGVFGSLLSTPILNPPQVGILGLHKIEERPISREGQVVIRPLMYVALSYDHRLVDGREAVQFLVRIKELIEDPTALLLEG